MSPACVAAWWRQLAPPGAELRAVLVRDGGALVGLAPFYLDPRRPGLRLPGIELGGRLAPLALEGHQRAVAGALAGALAGSPAFPDLLALEGVPLAARWARDLRDSWPGRLRAAAGQFQVTGCPTVSLQASSFDEWFAAKSSSFRAEMRRLRRSYDAAGGTMRMSTKDTVRADVDVFVRLHASRWGHRGGSKLTALGDALSGVLCDIGESLLDHDRRFLLRVFEIDGEPVCAQVFLPAGGRVQYLAAGWDERFAKFKPTLMGMLAAVEDGFEHGDECVDLGSGEQHYKLRFADGSDPVAWNIVIPVGARMPLALMRTAPMLGRVTAQNMLKRRLSDQQVATLRQRLQRLGA